MIKHLITLHLLLTLGYIMRKQEFYLLIDFVGKTNTSNSNSLQDQSMVNEIETCTGKKVEVNARGSTEGSRIDRAYL